MTDYFLVVANQSPAMFLQHKACLLFVISIFLGGAGAWFVSRTPLRIKLMDCPNERSSHSVSVPRGGGFGILLVVILAGLSLKLSVAFLFSAIMVSLVSFYGDFFQLSVKIRLAVQFIAALIFIFPLLPGITSSYGSSTPVISPVFFFLLALVLLIYLVGSMNFYNFMDGINGIAGICGAVGFGLLGAFSFIHSANPSAQPLSIFSICIALACIGFLPFNMPKARVFLGDMGSILLGFVFAGMALTFSGNYFDLICISSFLFPFYADELTTMFIRLKDRENLINPHRRHLYQLLVNEMGIAHWKISTGYGVLQMLVGVTIIQFYSCGAGTVLMALVMFSFFFVAVSTVVRRRVKAV
jgi:Fuc2NAc and GlcNAc transferase